MSKYLSRESDRYNYIFSNTPDMFSFEHQEAQDIDAFRGGIYENSIAGFNFQDNDSAGKNVRRLSSNIEAAANEFDIDADLFKAVVLQS